VAPVYANGSCGASPLVTVQENDVPKSKVRKKNDGPVRMHQQTLAAQAPRGLAPSPSWYPIVMATVLVLGLAYLVVYYIAASKIGWMNDLGAWNFAIGFGVMLVGLIMAVRWR
jgi:hypothetical protein